MTMPTPDGITLPVIGWGCGYFRSWASWASLSPSYCEFGRRDHEVTGWRPSPQRLEAGASSLLQRDQEGVTAARVNCYPYRNYATCDFLSRSRSYRLGSRKLQ